MVRVGIAGIGFMGWIHYLAYQQVPSVKLTAIATRDPKKLAGDWRGIQGNFGPPGEQVNLDGVAKHEELEALIADPNVDLIDLCLPPDLHCDATIRALEAGKHVFVEKPMALTADECQRMVAAAQRTGKQVLVGQVLPFFPEYAYARHVIASGQYGALLGGSFKRIISDPLWLKDFYDPLRVGGPLVDLHVHDAHFIRFLFGLPTSVTSQGRMRGEVVEFCNTLFQFADPRLVVSASSGVINQQGRSFTHGFEIHLERATLNFELAWVAGESKPRLLPLTVFDDSGKAVTVDLGESGPIDAFQLEIQEVVKSLESGTPSPILGGDLACDAVVLCHKQTESVLRGGQPIPV
ncbi:MAG: Gfo/Idh/MocA family protein [Planctomycetota bacterium]